jgi:mRNA interferase RelE/StbE
MIVLYDKSFSKSIDAINDKPTKNKLLAFIDKAKNATNIQELSSVKKIKGYKNYYRYRFGNYRVGFEQIDNQTIALIVVAKRNDIYKLFP